MSSRHQMAGVIDLDTAFKLFGAVAIAIAIVLTIGVLALSTPLGAFLADSPWLIGTLVFTLLLIGIGAVLSRSGHRTRR